MKKIISLILLLVLAVPVYASIKPNVVVSEYRVDREISVGKEFLLTVTFKNMEPSTCAKQVLANVEANYPYIAQGIGTIYLGDLCYQDSLVAKFPLKIDPSAIGGSYSIKVNTNYQTQTFVQYADSDIITLYVQGTPNLNAHITGLSPIDVYPGDSANLVINVDNLGDYKASSVMVALESQAPLQVKWGKSFNSLGTIDPKQSKPATFALELPKNAPATDYSIKATITYLDQNNAIQKKEQQFVFKTSKRAEFDIIGTESFYPNSNSKKVSVEIKNTGTDEAKKMKIRLIPQFPYSADGSVRYIENLGVGKSEKIDFVVDTDKDATAGQYGLDLLVDFEDAQGKKMQTTTKLVLSIKEEELFRKVVLDFWFLWAVALFVAVIVVIKKSKKKK